MDSYPRAIERAFINEKKKPFHKIAISGDTTPHANQWIELLNNTVKERYKVQRGWKNDNTPLRNGQALYYNYIRPHMTHNGKTPAQVAGIGVQGENKWMELLKKDW